MTAALRAALAVSTELAGGRNISSAMRVLPSPESPTRRTTVLGRARSAGTSPIRRARSSFSVFVLPETNGT